MAVEMQVGILFPLFYREHGKRNFRVFPGLGSCSFSIPELKESSLIEFARLKFGPEASRKSPALLSAGEGRIQAEGRRLMRRGEHGHCYVEVMDIAAFREATSGRDGRPGRLPHELEQQLYTHYSKLLMTPENEHDWVVAHDHGAWDRLCGNPVTVTEVQRRFPRVTLKNHPPAEERLAKVILQEMVVQDGVLFIRCPEPVLVANRTGVTPIFGADTHLPVRTNSKSMLLRELPFRNESEPRLFRLDEVQEARMYAEARAAGPMLPELTLDVDVQRPDLVWANAAGLEVNLRGKAWVASASATMHGLPRSVMKPYLQAKVELGSLPPTFNTVSSWRQVAEGERLSKDELYRNLQVVHGAHAPSVVFVPEGSFATEQMVKAVERWDGRRRHATEWWDESPARRTTSADGLSVVDITSYAEAVDMTPVQCFPGTMASVIAAREQGHRIVFLMAAVNSAEAEARGVRKEGFSFQGLATIDAEGAVTWRMLPGQEPSLEVMALMQSHLNRTARPPEPAAAPSPAMEPVL